MKKHLIAIFLLTTLGTSAAEVRDAGNRIFEFEFRNTGTKTVTALLLKTQQENGMGRATATHYTLLDSKLFPRFDRVIAPGELRKFPLNSRSLPEQTNLSATVLGILYEDGSSEGTSDGIAFLQRRRAVGADALTASKNILSQPVAGPSDPSVMAAKIEAWQKAYAAEDKSTDAHLSGLLANTTSTLLHGIEVTLRENPSRTIPEAVRLVNAVRVRVDAQLAELSR
jgi:hypothetical protein